MLGLWGFGWWGIAAAAAAVRLWWGAAAAAWAARASPAGAARDLAAPALPPGLCRACTLPTRWMRQPWDPTPAVSGAQLALEGLAELQAHALAGPTGRTPLTLTPHGHPMVLPEHSCRGCAQTCCSYCCSSSLSAAAPAAAPPPLLRQPTACLFHRLPVVWGVAATTLLHNRAAPCRCRPRPAPQVCRVPADPAFPQRWRHLAGAGPPQDLPLWPVQHVRRGRHRRAGAVLPPPPRPQLLVRPRGWVAG